MQSRTNVRVQARFPGLTGRGSRGTSYKVVGYRSYVVELGGLIDRSGWLSLHFAFRPVCEIRRAVDPFPRFTSWDPAVREYSTPVALERLFATRPLPTPRLRRWSGCVTI